MNIGIKLDFCSFVHSLVYHCTILTNLLFLFLLLHLFYLLLETDQLLVFLWLFCYELLCGNILFYSLFHVSFGGLSRVLDRGDQLVYGKSDRFALWEDRLLGVWPLQGTLRALYPALKLVNQENTLVLHLLQLFLLRLREGDLRFIAYKGQTLGLDRRSHFPILFIGILQLARGNVFSGHMVRLSDVHRLSSEHERLYP